MQSKIKKRGSGGWRRLALSALLGVGLALMSVAQTLAAPSFQEAVADYQAGRYAQALGKLEAVKAAYPSNALVHYYVALCQQAVGHIEQAKVEYQWVISSRDPKLAPMATTGLSQLSGVRVSGSGGGSSSGSSSPTMAAPAGGGAKTANAKVSKILEFWATW